MHSKYSCDLCDFRTTDHTALLYHTKYKHELCCLMCRKSYRKGEDPQQHKCDEVSLNIIFIDSHRAKCRLCDFETLKLTGIRRHIRTTHMKSTYVTCNICQKTFQYNHNLQLHMRRQHKLEDTYSCKRCKFRCCTEEDFEAHIKKQHNPNQFSVPQEQDIANQSNQMPITQQI